MDNLLLVCHKELKMAPNAESLEHKKGYSN
jgi:hypothetical protein